MTTAADIMKQIRDNDVKFVDLRFTDPRGKLQHVTMDIAEVEEDMFADGVMFDGSSIAGWKAINESDMVLMPDTETVHMDPFFAQSTMVILCDILDPVSGEAYNRDPRGTAKKADVKGYYIGGKTAYTASYSNSKESDYVSDNWHVGISQDMFGDLTTVTMGYTRGFDTVSARSGNTISKMGQVDRRSYDLGLSQIFTRNLIGSVMLEVITDEGFLNNPYRFVRYADLTDARGWNTQPEAYPHTRTSTALTAKARYYLWYRAAASASYRYFSDTWGIRGNTLELGYTHPLGNRWIIEGRVRLYRQNAANFYSDLFSRRDAFNFLARDKDLAAGQNISLGGKLTYAFLPDGWKMFKRGTVTLDVSRIQFKYDDFRDIKDYGVANGYTAGTEPLYRFHANVMQLYASMFF